MGTFHAIALDSSGQAWSAGANNHGQLGRETKTVPASTFGKVDQSVPFRDISAGNNVSFFIQQETNNLYYSGQQAGLKDQI